MKNVKYVLGLVLGLVVLVAVQWPSADLRMIVCDVGQGDAILIIKGSMQVLVDGGPSGSRVLACLRRYVPFWDRRLELVVMTNTDNDHMGGLSDVLERYQVDTFVTGDGIKESEALGRFAEVVKLRGVRVEGVESGDVIKVGDEVEFKVLWPDEIVSGLLAVFQESEGAEVGVLGEESFRGDVNERSVVLLLVDGDASVLLMGDVGFETEESMADLGILSDVDVLKVGHHGSKYSSGEEFLGLVDPELAVVSAGRGNSYGHPTSEVLERLEGVGARVRRTDLEGDVVLVFE